MRLPRAGSAAPEPLPEPGMPAQAGGWAVEAAVDIFFTSGMSSGAAAPPPAPSANARALEALYQRYKDPHGDMILAEGVGKFCEDLRVSPAAGCRGACLPGNQRVGKQAYCQRQLACCCGMSKARSRRCCISPPGLKSTDGRLHVRRWTPAT